MLNHFSWRHIPALLTAAPMFLGELFHGLLEPKAALLTWGMVEEVAQSREAQIVYYGHTMRTSTLGIIFIAVWELTVIGIGRVVLGEGHSTDGNTECIGFAMDYRY
ncbi:uncharacterized protein EAF02_001697 [Botrytis sinoallii]|uniref:uncharacterized protein n=1 Tax=Botrytis sinoallii TaxID=1463999 RepID=UPI001901C712|nr:uncharacterized protein EAF02_001697 [Botrytis sinoallii]KAF7891372.1 hypothetical protein EAF02_001697 [Botrytis sinoallii]